MIDVESNSEDSRKKIKIKKKKKKKKKKASVSVENNNISSHQNHHKTDLETPIIPFYITIGGVHQKSNWFFE
jgi:hypothetical protein